MARRNFYLGVVVILTIGFLGVPAEATNAMKLIGIGPIQRSMGGATVGLPLDAATTITNPAGISQVGQRVDFGFSLFCPDVEYKANSSFGQVTANDSIKTSDMTSFVVPAFGLVKDIDDTKTFGLGAYGISGMGVDYESNLYNNVTFTEYAYMKIAPTLAYQVNDQLSIGFSPNIDYAKMDYHAGSTSEVAHHGGTAYGYGYSLGLLYAATPKISLGLAYESPQWFEDFEFNTTSGKDKLAFDQPQSLTAGIGLKPDDRLRVAFDVSWVDWSRTNGENMPAYTQNSSSATAWNMNWRDQIVYKIGFEYDLSKTIQWRGGYNYGENPLNTNQPFENIAFPAISEHHITTGIGVNLDDNFALNLGFMYAPKVKLETGNTAQFVDSATTTMSQYSLDIGLTYYFD